MKKPVIGVILGDPSGIGPEIIAKAAAEGTLTKDALPLLIGDEWMLKSGMGIAGVTVEYDVLRAGDLPERGALSLAGSRIALLDLSCMAAPAQMGQMNAACGKAAVDMMKAAVSLSQKGQIDGICFAPFNKAAIKLSGYDAESELHVFCDLFGGKDTTGEINVADGLFTTRVTSHIPLMEVGASLSVDSILEAARMLHRILLRAGKKEPVIAICALNPHGGESGQCGREEIDIILPACEAAKKEGILAAGVFPADTIFVNAFSKRAYDGVVTMFHDQGQIALKMRDFRNAVTLEEGLPVPVGTPAHGTAFDIAGKNMADAAAFNAAYGIINNLSSKDG